VERSRFHCKLINREISCVLLLSLANSATKPAVLTHRPEKFRLTTPSLLSRGTHVIELFRGALGILVHFQSRSLLRSKTLVVGTPVRKGLNSMETTPELSKDWMNFKTLRFTLAEIGKGYGVAVGDPRRHLLGPTYRILKVSSPGSRRLRNFFNQGTARRKFHKVSGLCPCARTPRSTWASSPHPRAIGRASAPHAQNNNALARETCTSCPCTATTTTRSRPTLTRS